MQYTINAARQGNSIQVRVEKDLNYVGKPIHSTPVGSYLAGSDEEAVQTVNQLVAIMKAKSLKHTLLGGADQLLKGQLKKVEEVVESSVTEDEEEI